jgi:hypothetical protein
MIAKAHKGASRKPGGGTSQRRKAAKAQRKKRLLSTVDRGYPGGAGCQAGARVPKRP